MIIDLKNIPPLDLEHLRRGVYAVGGENFSTSKIQALEQADKTDQSVTWHFHDQTFADFNWLVEPPGSLEYYYSQRCQQVRDKYDYLILYYSGGADSHNILTHFWKNKIHIDEIFVAFPVKYFETFCKVSNSRLTKDSHNEWFRTVKPDLAWIAKNMPRTKITVYDYTDDVLNFNVDQDWILHTGEHINPNIANRIQRYYKIDSVNVYDKYKVGHLYGIDKPLVFTDDNQWYLSFLDSAVSIQTSFKPVFDKHTHIHIEYFYWSVDAGNMLIKQAHTLKNYYENNPQYLHLASYGQKTPEEKEQERNITRRAVYPYWRDDVFQTGKANNSFFKEFDLWFFDHASGRSVAKWYEGYSYLLSSLDKKWIKYDENNRPSGLKGFYSRWHKIGDVKNDLLIQ